MAFDSSANLLFNIGANTDDATGNIQRFRGILSKDLSDLTGEFGDWSNKVFGSITTVSGAVTAAAAGMGAALVAMAAGAIESANKYEEFVSEVGKGSKMTGIAIETMSGLHYAAKATGTGYEELTRGITRFQAEVVKANAKEEDRIKLAGRLGVSTAAVAAGEKNIMPLLEATMDRFHGLASGTERAALARELFSRNGVELLGFLKLGSEGLREMTAEAQRLGLVLSVDDVNAVREHKAAQREMREEWEAVAVTLGRKVLPLITAFTVGMIGLVETIKSGRLIGMGLWEDWRRNSQAAFDRIQQLTRTMMAMGDQDLGPSAEKVKEAKENWYGFSTILDQVKLKLAATQGEDQKIVQELMHLGNELQKAQEEYNKLAKEGKITSESAAREAQRMRELPAAIAALTQAQFKQLADKRAAELTQAHDDLMVKLEAQEEQTTAVQVRHWEDEIVKLRDHYAKKNVLTATNEKLIEDIHTAGLQKILRAQVDAYQQELEQLQAFWSAVVSVRMTAQEKLTLQYDVDVQRFSAAEEEKALKLARSEGEQEAIRQQFAMNRAAALQKYGNDLIALQNSQGWQGVFGSRFATLLAHDENALREWSQSADQAFNLVGQRAVAMEGLGRKAFQTFADGMGQNIAHAIIYEQSIGKAMRSALAATLEAIAAESMVQAIYAAALGFVRLAQHDYPAATAAFTAAATFGLVGGAAAVAGRLIAPHDAAGAGAGAGAGGQGSGVGGDAAASGGQQAPTVNVYVSGVLYGHIDNLIDAVNDAVLVRDKSLIATKTTQGGTVYR